MVMALVMNVGVYDINNIQPIQNASVIITNSTHIINSSTTGVLGAVTLSASSPTNRYNISVSREGYFSGRFENETTADQTYLFYLAPISDDGIIKLVFVDKTFQDHELCIFFTENGRLKGCYRQNDTIKLTTNTEYDFIVKPSDIDLFTQPENIGSNIWLLIPIITGLIVFGGLCALVVRWLYENALKRRGKN